MTDPIERQAAIDFIAAGHLCNPNEPRWSDNDVVNFLKSRPSAQPDVLDTNVGDMINRQAAIDAPERFIKDCNPEHFVGHQKFIEFMDDDEIWSFGNWQFANGFNMGLTAAEVAIKKLPSAQCTGRWIEHKDYPGLAYLCSECNYFTTVKSYYCPQCGADMRGEQGG